MGRATIRGIQWRSHQWLLCSLLQAIPLRTQPAEHQAQMRECNLNTNPQAPAGPFQSTGGHILDLPQSRPAACVCVAETLSCITETLETFPLGLPLQIGN